MVSDPVYSIVQDIEICQNKKGIIIQLRNFKGLNKNFLDDLANAIKSIRTNETISVFSFQNEIDEKICKDFIEILKNKGIEAKYIPNQTIDKTIEIVNNAKYMISTRLHGVLISHALKTKTFALIYDKKIETITEELNIDSFNIFNYKKNEPEEKIQEFFNKENKTNDYRKFNWDCIDNILN